MLDDELRALVSTDPAADFTARVSETVRNDSPRPLWAWQAAFALAASLALAVLLPYLGTENHKVPAVGTLAATPVGRADVPLREAISAARHENQTARAAVVSGSITGSNGRTTASEIQLDPIERRALRALFTHPPRAYVELLEAPDSPLVIPAVQVQPLQLDSLSEGASQ